MSSKKEKLFPNSVFVDEYEQEIESAVKRNLSRLTDKKSIKKSHTKIVEILQKEKQDDNKYLDFETYKNLIENARKEKEERLRKKMQKQQEEDNTH